MAPRNLTYTRPWLYPKQHAAIFAPERYAIIEASTKSGKTVGCMAWAIEQALAGKPGQHVWWVAPILEQAKIAYERFKRGLPRALYKANESIPRLLLVNQVAITFKGADKADSLYGEDVIAAVIDEATRCKEESWHAVRSTLTATRGPIRIIGNVKGRKNWAYRLARKAEAREPDMHYARLTAHEAVEAGILQAAEVEDAKRQLPDHIFRELYLAEPSDDEGNPFGLEAIAACVGPLSDAPAAVWGWDLAKSVDWTEGIALDLDGRVCRHVRWQQPWEETIRSVLDLCGETPALIDATGVGDPIVERLQRAEGARIEGFKFTATSKQQLMEGLAVALQRHEIRVPDDSLRAQLESFEYVLSRTGVRYSAPEGMHDDGVCALALAVQHYQQRVAHGWTLRLLDPESAPRTHEEQVAWDRETREKAHQDVLDEIRETGFYWPGGAA